MSVETRHVKYVFADVVAFTEGRTVQAQMEIVGALNQAFRDAVGEMATIFLPTGDGICAAIIQPNASADAHLKVALGVIEKMHEWSEAQSEDRKCTVRFGLNESVDCMVRDINGRENIAGAGINQAQRLMAMADGNQIVVGRAAYDNLRVWDEYVHSFRALRAESKHGVIIESFQYVGTAPALNTDIPQAVRDSDPIDLRFADATARASTNAYTAAAYRAVEEWENEVSNLMYELIKAAKTMEDQNNPLLVADGRPKIELARLLTESQAAFEKHRQLEDEFVGQYRTTGGTMWKSLGAEHALEIIRHRAKLLRDIASNWFGITTE